MSSLVSNTNHLPAALQVPNNVNLSPKEFIDFLLQLRSPLVDALKSQMGISFSSEEWRNKAMMSGSVIDDLIQAQQLIAIIDEINFENNQLQVEKERLQILLDKLEAVLGSKAKPTDVPLFIKLQKYDAAYKTTNNSKSTSLSKSELEQIAPIHEMLMRMIEKLEEQQNELRQAELTLSKLTDEYEFLNSSREELITQDVINALSGKFKNIDIAGLEQEAKNFVAERKALKAELIAREDEVVEIMEEAVINASKDEDKKERYDETTVQAMGEHVRQHGANLILGIQGIFAAKTKFLSLLADRGENEDIRQAANIVKTFEVAEYKVENRINKVKDLLEKAGVAIDEAKNERDALKEKVEQAMKQEEQLPFLDEDRRRKIDKSIEEYRKAKAPNAAESSDKNHANIKPLHNKPSMKPTDGHR